MLLSSSGKGYNLCMHSASCPCVCMDKSAVWEWNSRPVNQTQKWRCPLLSVVVHFLHSTQLNSHHSQAETVGNFYFLPCFAWLTNGFWGNKLTVSSLSGSFSSLFKNSHSFTPTTEPLGRNWFCGQGYVLACSVFASWWKVISFW